MSAGLLAGCALSLYVSLTPFVSFPHSLWLAANDVLFVASLVLIAILSYKHRARHGSLKSMLLGVAVFFGVIAVLYLGGYLLTTAFLSDRMVWFPLDYRDYTYHGFTSVRDYLNHGNNFWDLLDLHTFSLLISSVIYFAAGGLGYGLKSLTMRGRNA